MNKKSKSGQLVLVGAFQLLVIVIIAGCWITNLVKFVGSDFEAPYKHEIVHGVGFIPGASIVTCWFNIPDGTNAVSVVE